jgi:hypothetical protein
MPFRRCWRKWPICILRVSYQRASRQGECDEGNRPVLGNNGATCKCSGARLWPSPLRKPPPNLSNTIHNWFGCRAPAKTPPRRSVS